MLDTRVTKVTEMENESISYEPVNSKLGIELLSTRW